MKNTFEAGQLDRLDGKPCASANGEYLNGWYGLDRYDSSDYDTSAMETDAQYGNFSPENVEDYRHENIVRASLINGQFSQARKQCQAYGLEYELHLEYFHRSQ